MAPIELIKETIRKCGHCRFWGSTCTLDGLKHPSADCCPLWERYRYDRACDLYKQARESRTHWKDGYR